MEQLTAEASVQVETDWAELWRGIVAPNGEVNVEQVKRELSDFRFLMNAVSKVYRHITGDQISKVMSDPERVCALADDHYAKFAKDDAKEAIALALDDREEDERVVLGSIRAALSDPMPIDNRLQVIQNVIAARLKVLDAGSEQTAN